MTIRVGPCDSETTRALRHAVLRPGQPLGVLDSPDDASSTNVAAWDGDRVVGCVRIFAAPYPDVPAAWQLRSMAVDPEYQGRGIGRLVLDAIVDQARARDVRMLWAHARTSALGFYQKAGWVTVGDEFLHPGSGLPHFVIILDLG